MTNEFPKIGINTAELIKWTDEMLEVAATQKDDFGGVNWGDLGIANIEYRLSIMRPDEGPYCMVTIEEASPSCRLDAWLSQQIDADKFPHTYFECEW